MGPGLFHNKMYVGDILSAWPDSIFYFGHLFLGVKTGLESVFMGMRPRLHCDSHGQKKNGLCFVMSI